MRSRGAITAGLALLLCAVACAPAGAADAEGPFVTILGPKELSFAASPGKPDASAELQIDNPTGAPAHFDLVLGASTLDEVKLDTKTLDVPPGVHRQKISVSGLKDLDKKGRAFLVAQIGNSRTAVPVTITNPRKSPRDVVVATFVVFLVLTGFALGIAMRAGQLAAPAGNPKWGFESWATSLTGAGAILTTVVSSATLPDVPQRFDKNTLTELSLVFALLVFIGPFLAKVLRKKPPSDATEAALARKYGVVNHHWAILVAASLVSAAVLGQLLTLALVARELANDATVRDVALGVTALLVVGALIYIWRTLFKELAPRDWMKMARDAETAEAAAFTWVKIKPDDPDVADVLAAEQVQRMLVAPETGEAPPAEAVVGPGPAQALVWKMP